MANVLATRLPPMMAKPVSLPKAMNAVAQSASLFPWLGYGLGLRRPHYATVEAQRPPVDWFEIISENFMELESGHGAPILAYLDRLREQYPLILHGVSLSLGSSDPLDRDYLRRLKALIARWEPAWISDHACWSSVDGVYLHDLLPLPFTEAVVQHLVSRISEVQAFLGQRMVIENVSSYISFAHSDMTEWDFLNEVLKRADCGLLLDINNVYVSSQNHGFDPWTYISALPADRIAQIHMAGFTDFQTWLLDSHDQPVAEPVWELYRKTLQHFGPITAMIERDEAIPPFEELLAECQRLRQISEEVARGAQLSPLSA